MPGYTFLAMRATLLLSALATLSAWTATPSAPLRRAPVAHSLAAAPIAVPRAGLHGARMILIDPEQDAARSVTSPDAGTRLLDSFLELFHGHFDNHDQVVANEAAGRAPREGGGHEHIHCVVRQVPVQGSGADGAHVLASYYFNGQPGAVFRERLYAFDVLSDDAQFGACVRMRIYKLRSPVTEQLRAAGGLDGYSADDVALSAADLADDLHVPDADVYWRWCGERFEGRMRSESLTIVSERSGKEIVVRDDVALWADALWVNDRGHDAETGAYIYGNIDEIPYKMRRVADTHWTATGAHNPAAPAEDADDGASSS